MLTLHTLSEQVKRVLKWVGGIIGVILFIYLMIRGGQFIKNTFFPTPPPPPTVGFGKLPFISFPQSVSDAEFAYSVDTLSGSLPSFPDRLTVYKTTSKESSLFDLDRTREKVKQLGFQFEGYGDIASESALSPVLYEWENHDTLRKKVTINIVTNNFRLTSNYLSTPSVLQPPYFPSEDDAKQRVMNTLQNMQLSPKDIDETKTRTELLQVNGTTLTPANSISNANIIRVDLFQKNLGELPIMYARPPYSPINFLIGGNDYLGDIIYGTFIHQDISELSETYPIKTATQAFDELQKGKAYIARYYGSEKSMPIREMYLAYFVSEEEQSYVQPIIVFEGKDGFVAYISAIPDEWHRDSTATK